MIRAWTTLLATLPLLSCTLVGKDFFVPETETPENWQDVSSKYVELAQPSVKWWETFNDPLLNELIEKAALHNHDIRIAIANLEQARALRREAAGAFFPSIGAGAAVERERLSRTLGGAGDRQQTTYSTQLDASWEIDVFGRIQREVESATAFEEATDAQRRAVLLAVLAEVAQNYFNVRGLQKRIEVTKANVALLGEIEEVAQAQFETGAVTEFDVARARGERQSIEAAIPNLEAELQAGMYRLAVLTGEQPQEALPLLQEAKPLPEVVDKVPVGLPSDLLRRRPDITRAERELAEATANIGIAEGALFPSFSLTGAIGTGALVFSDVFTGGAFSYAFGPALNWNIFQGGALRARVEAAEAAEKAALARYEQAVLLALEDVQASLVRYGKEWETLKAFRTTLDSREDAVRISRLRYEGGEENFLVVLDAERGLISARDEIVQSETRILTKLAQLYKALGGGWEAFEPAESSSPSAS